jgi:hypothetical protein
VRLWLQLLTPYPGFHPLPPRTVREVFAHTALRQPSSDGFRGYATHTPCLNKYSSPLRTIRMVNAFSFQRPLVPLIHRTHRLNPMITMGVDHRPNETSPVPSSAFTTSRPPYARGAFGAAFPGSSHLPWRSLSLKSSALPCSPFGANISTLQGLLHVAGCGFALLSQEVTTLQHLRSPRGTGCLLRGGLTLTATGLSPASRRQLSGHTIRWLARRRVETLNDVTYPLLYLFVVHLLPSLKQWNVLRIAGRFHLIQQ